ncbi:FAD-containing oxidoreductase [Granulicella sp. 5B5]|uniref:FAD-containing oxidoreductase n=1 Tax=Granulicella sp. 5B5 TaxID=1617967 RepID=UPI0015F451FE|nr:FAD-containing oxidoreductase [Granulicella sp. 5B5]QMV19769.1 FAD-containing oxidoreductase [Granulicella sp. 5B5]
MNKTFDAIIVGAGQAGPSLAGRFNDAGKSVALIERKLLGGTCVNTGCTPTKAMVASAYAAHLIRRASDFGLPAQQLVGVDLAAVKRRKDSIVSKSRQSLEKWLTGMEHCTLIRGTARLSGPHSITVNDEVLQAKQIFLNVGTRAFVPNIPGIDEVPWLTNTTILELETLPEHLVIVGGNYVGLEFAQIFRRFGSEVTVVERKPRLVSHEDTDVSDEVQKILESEGIHIRTGAECIRLERLGSQPIVHVDCTDGEPAIKASHVLLATGRTPNTDDLGLESAGIERDEHGFIPVNARLETSAPGIWALGDCNGRGAFTHTSYNDYEIAAANLLDGGSRSVDDRIPCSALFIDPPLAHIGMNEHEVRERGKPALIGMRSMTRVGRAVEKGETSGFMKVLVDAENQQILGATILGTGGDEAIHCILTAMYAHQPASLLQHSVHIHPTVAELIPTVFGELKPLI